MLRRSLEVIIVRANVTRVVRWAVPAGGVVLLAVLIEQIGPEAIGALVSAIGWTFPVVVVLFGCEECLRALALSRCLPDNARPPLRQLLRIRFMGEAVRILTHTGPFVAEPARAWMLTRHGVDGPRAYGAALSELMANSIVAALMTALMVGAGSFMVDLSPQLSAISRALLVVTIGYLVVALTALVNRVYVIGGSLKAMAALPVAGGWLRTDAAKVRQMEDAMFHVLTDSPETLAEIMLIEVAAQTLLVLEVYWSIRSMGASAGAGTALAVEALTKVADVIPFIGATDGAYAVVFSWLGMGAAMGLTLSLVRRVRSLTVAALGLGLLALLEPWRENPVLAQAVKPLP